jgi:hypothetical protein
MAGHGLQGTSSGPEAHAWRRSTPMADLPQLWADGGHVDAKLIHLVNEPFADGHHWTIVGPLMHPSPHAIELLDPPDRVNVCSNSPA